MLRQEEIEAQIEELKKQLEVSRNYYRFELVCDDANTAHMIGFFDMGKFRKLITLLYEGKKLQMRHSCYVDTDVYMNPQGNRICVKGSKSINEDNILHHMLWGSGNWYINNEK
jgi:hypothetical protein